MLHAIFTFGAWTIVVFCFGAAFSSFDFGSGLPGWLAQHDGLSTALVAAFGIIVAVQQIEAGRKQHQATIRLSLKNELEAVRSAARYAEAMLRQCSDTRADIVSALIGNVPHRTYWKPDSATLDTISKYAGEHVVIFTDILVRRIEEFQEWQDAGSPTLLDIFGTKPPSFSERVDDIGTSCLTLVEVCRIRTAELEKYITG